MARPTISSVIGARQRNFALAQRPMKAPIAAERTKQSQSPGGTAAARAPPLMLNGNQDGMRGRAGGNCAYTAQSYGASIQENEMADMLTSNSGCGRPRRKLRIKPIATKKAPPM